MWLQLKLRTRGNGDVENVYKCEIPPGFSEPWTDSRVPATARAHTFMYMYSAVVYIHHQLHLYPTIYKYKRGVHGKREKWRWLSLWELIKLWDVQSYWDLRKELSKGNIVQKFFENAHQKNIIQHVQIYIIDIWI